MSETWPDDEVAKAADWITDRTGLTFSPSRIPDATRAFQKAMSTRATRDAASLRSRLESDPASLDELLADLTIGETYFFRHPAQIDLVRDLVLPSIPPRTDRAARLWSAGCATGEEAYTLAMVARSAGRSAEVVGTDLSQARLSIARRGRYTDWSLRGVSQETIRKHFRVSGKQYEVDPAVRDMVEFRYLNLVEDRFPALSTGIWGMDVILCRNVLIYLDRASVKRVVQKLVDSLSDEGWLLLGASDPMISDLVPVHVVVTEAGLAYQNRSGGRSTPPAPRGPTGRPPPPAAIVNPPAVPLVTEPPPPAPAPKSDELLVAAVERSEKVRTEDPQDYGLVRALIEIRELADRGELALAGVACAGALDRYRDSAELLYLHALLLLAGGHPHAAAEAARRALYLDRSLLVTHLLMGDALLRTGDLQGAQRSLRQAARMLAELPGDAEVPAADGEPAGRLLRMVETRLHLLDGPRP